MIHSFGFGNFFRQQIAAKETAYIHEMRTAIWNSGRQNPSGGQSKPTIKDMQARLTITFFFQRKQEKSVINDEIQENPVFNEGSAGDVSDVIVSESKPLLTASNLERFIAQLGKNQ